MKWLWWMSLFWLRWNLVLKSDLNVRKCQILWNKINFIRQYRSTTTPNFLSPVGVFLLRYITRLKLLIRPVYWHPSKITLDLTTNVKRQNNQQPFVDIFLNVCEHTHLWITELENKRRKFHEWISQPSTDIETSVINRNNTERKQPRRKTLN